MADPHPPPTRPDRIGAATATAGWAALILFASVVLGGIAVHPAIPVGVRLVFVSFFLASVAAPSNTLLALCAFLPLTTLLGHLGGTPLARPEHLALCWAGGALVRLRPWRTALEIDTVLRSAAILLGMVLVCSTVVTLAAVQIRTAPVGEFLLMVVRYLARDYVIGDTRMSPIAAAANWSVAIAMLLTAGVIAARTGVTACLRMAPLGATAVAALNVARFAEILLRTGHSWNRVLMDARINVLFGDVNSAGSYFVLFFFAACGLAAERGGRIWYAAAALLVGAVWLTGSRAAILAVLVVAILFAMRGAISGATARSRRTALTLSAIAIAATILTVWFFPRGFLNREGGTAVAIRAGMSAAALRMTAAHPIFGVGLGRFWTESAAYLGADMKQYFSHENAHDDALQILAELGLVGFICWVAVVIRVAGLLRKASRVAPAAGGAATGLLGFMLTSIVGHPLLTPDVLFSVALVAGIAIGAAPRLSRAYDRGISRVAAALAIGILLALPFRVAEARRSADLEHVGYQLSTWQTDELGNRYRWMGSHASLFAPTDGSRIDVPLRLAPDVPGAFVTLHVDGRVADRMRLAAHDWTTATLLYPAERPGRTLRIDIDVQPDALPAEPTHLVMVGKSLSR